MPDNPPTDSFHIRAAARTDLPAIVAMRDALNALERAGCPHAVLRRLTLEEFTALWGHTFDDEAYCWRIVETAGRPVGFGLIYLLTPRTDPPAAFVHWAYLTEGTRRQGRGRALFAHLLEWARGRGAGRVELQYIDGNEGAREFWERMGFRPYARKCVREL